MTPHLSGMPQQPHWILAPGREVKEQLAQCVSCPCEQGPPLGSCSHTAVLAWPGPVVPRASPAMGPTRLLPVQVTHGMVGRQGPCPVQCGQTWPSPIMPGVGRAEAQRGACLRAGQGPRDRLGVATLGATGLAWETSFLTDPVPGREPRAQAPLSPQEWVDRAEWAFV